MYTRVCVCMCYIQTNVLLTSNTLCYSLLFASRAWPKAGAAGPAGRSRRRGRLYHNYSKQLYYY